MDDIFAETLRAAFEPLGLSPDAKQTEKFYRYWQLLGEWNKKINLISEKSFENVTERHFADSLSLTLALPDAGVLCEGKSLIDVGTGAGLPGIPIKIMFPATKLTLLDSQAKKVDFLDEAIKELELENAAALWSRAEDAGKDPEYRERFDICVSRAVAPLSVLLELALPLVKVGGLFLAYKTSAVDQELDDAGKALNILGGKVWNIAQLKIAGVPRSIVVIEKISQTPEKYPRRAGMPEKRPLQPK